MFLFDSEFNLNNEKHEALVIFSGQLEGSAEDYGYSFESKMRNDNPRPRMVFFIYPNYLIQEIRDISGSGTAFYDNIIRYGENTPVIFCSFDDFGCLSVERAIFTNKKNINLSGFLDSIVKDGVLSLAKKRKDSVILKSPPGTVFVKPSKKQLDEFIQASGLTVGYSENQFLAFSLLKFRPRNIDIKNIYIDTSGISSFIEALTYYLYRFSSEVCKSVKYHSFNSYFGLNTQKPDDTTDIWVIISASNSNSLGKKIVKEWSVTNEQVVTVLSYNDKSEGGKGDTIICNLSVISDRYKNPDKFVTPISVKVIGENFTAQVSEPNQVIIKNIHKTPEINKCINPYNNSNVFKCSKTSSSDRAARPIFIDMAEVLDEDKKLAEWIKSIATWYIPTTLKWIVYDENSESGKKLYSLVCNCLPLDSSITSLSFKDAETEVSSDGAVLILEPVISDGKSLLRLNRNLRISGHNGNRIFLCPFVTASSKEKFVNFKKSLIFGPNNLKYQFFSYYELYIGHSDADSSWILERNVVENLESEFWQSRARVLNAEGTGIDGRVGTPSLTEDETLSFAQDFAFWNAGYNCDSINPEAVYTTVSSILQGLREKPYSDDDRDSLYSHVYQHSVIDPENFTRFNDGLLQSCLWRSANASEVDYKSSENLSESFAGILSRLIDDMSKGCKNSTLDLFMGVAVGKIALTKNVLNNLLKDGHNKLSKYKHAIELLDYINNEFLS